MKIFTNFNMYIYLVGSSQFNDYYRNTSPNSRATIKWIGVGENEKFDTYKSPYPYF